MLLSVEATTVGGSLFILGVYHIFGLLSSLLLFVTCFVSVCVVGLIFVFWCGKGFSVFCGFEE